MSATGPVAGVVIIIVTVLYGIPLGRARINVREGLEPPTVVLRPRAVRCSARTRAQRHEICRNDRSVIAEVQPAA